MRYGGFPDFVENLDEIRFFTGVTGFDCRFLRLEGPLWEMRMKGKDGISRAVYVTAKGHRVVVVRVFVKKTQKTPRREIEIALQGAEEVQDQ